MEPLAIGTVVDYHGSHTHGRYVVVEHHNPEDLFSDEEIVIATFVHETTLSEAYPDGVAYSILPVGMEYRFGNMRTYGISRVRRGSLTVAMPPVIFTHDDFLIDGKHGGRTLPLTSAESSDTQEVASEAPNESKASNEQDET